MYKPESIEEEEFLKKYNPDKYKKPSITTDIVVFTMSEDKKLCILLIKRGTYPYKDHWALPGGFINMDESIDQSAASKLYEETGANGFPIVQFGSFGDVDRDPRMRVVSISYMAFVPNKSLEVVAGDKEADADVFEVRKVCDDKGTEKLYLVRDYFSISEEQLAFDHATIIKTALERLAGRIEYTQDAFSLLQDDKSFTIHELKSIHEAVLFKSLDTANFRREFIKKYVDTGIVVPTGKTSNKYSARAAQLYCKVR